MDSLSNVSVGCPNNASNAGGLPSPASSTIATNTTPSIFGVPTAEPNSDVFLKSCGDEGMHA